MTELTAAELVGVQTAPKRQGTRTNSDGVQSNVLFGLLATLGLVGGVGYWISATSLAGAVIASGIVAVKSSVKNVQHQTGGVISEILVRNGDYVEAGAVVLRLDDTLTRSNLEVVSDQLDRTSVRRARLEAEIAEANEMEIPTSLMEGRDENAIAALIVGERALFANRRRSLHSKITTLKSRNEQYRQQIVGLAAQRQASENTVKVLARDLVTVRDLYERKLVPLDRMSTIELRITEQTGEIGRLTAAMAEVEGRISENALQVIQLEDDFREAANSELREAEAREAELIGRRAIAVDQQARTTLRSPQAGVIQELAVFTVGGVVTPGQTLMTVVPKEDDLVVDARIPPARIDEVVSDQPVTIRFSAFDRNTTPECHGTIEHVSPDLIRDTEERVSYYAARILIGDRDSCLGNDQNLIPGMPVEVHIHTGDRSVWSYLMKPLLDQLNRSMRE